MMSNFDRVTSEDNAATSDAGDGDDNVILLPCEMPVSPDLRVFLVVLIPLLIIILVLSMFYFCVMKTIRSTMSIRFKDDFICLVKSSETVGMFGFFYF